MPIRSARLGFPNNPNLRGLNHPVPWLKTRQICFLSNYFPQMKIPHGAESCKGMDARAKAWMLTGMYA